MSSWQTRLEGSIQGKTDGDHSSSNEEVQSMEILEVREKNLAFKA
jgi:hypothetical protein